MIAFLLYQGKTTPVDGNLDLDCSFGKCRTTVFCLADKIIAVEHCQQLPFYFMMDNLFTITKLFRALKARGCEGTDTVRQNNVKKDPLPSTTDMKKKARGTSVSAESNDGVLKYTKWKDNQVVFVL